MFVTTGLPRLVSLPEVHVEGEVHELLTDLTGEETLDPQEIAVNSAAIHCTVAVYCVVGCSDFGFRQRIDSGTEEQDSPSNMNC